MHHDPLLSNARKPFFSFGHVWVVLALWVSLPLGDGRGFALPLLFRLYTTSKRGGKKDAPAHPTKGKRTAAAPHNRPTKLQLAREVIALLAGWAEDRTIYVVAQSAYAGRTLVEQRPANVHIISRLRMDAALWTPPPPRARARQAGLVSAEAACPRPRNWPAPIATGTACQAGSTAAT